MNVFERSDAEEGAEDLGLSCGSVVGHVIQDGGGREAAVAKMVVLRIGEIFRNERRAVCHGVFAESGNAVAGLVVDEGTRVGLGREAVPDGCRCETSGEGVKEGTVDGFVDKDAICGDAYLSGHEEFESH